MLLETLLPLGKVDPGLRAPEIPLDLHSIAADARLLEEIGYDGLVVEETKDDPFILLALAAQTTRTLRLGTSVAIAFPRSPTVTAMSAWTPISSDVSACPGRPPGRGCASTWGPSAWSGIAGRTARRST